ncbi:MAG: DUF3748 domain-containing protein [Bacteroidota bacterium]
MNQIVKRQNNLFILLTTILLILSSCNQPASNKNSGYIPMKERQITFSEKNHALDNNDNFSPDDKFLCYDTRGTVYNDNLANCKSIEKVEIKTGVETVIWKPESITGEYAAPGVAAVSYHPFENKVVFIHGPFLDEVEERGYYGIRNRTGVEVSADGKQKMIKVDMRDISTERPTTPGAQRGGTHRHEYSRNGKRIGFTYDDFLNEDYDRTIGYVEPSNAAPEGYTHYFAVLLKPAKKEESKPGEIEKAYGDSWVDAEGTRRAFIGKVRADNGVDYETDLFVAEIPDSVDITSAFSEYYSDYPTPPKDIIIRRLTYDKQADGIARSSLNGKQIAFFAPDTKGIKQVFIIPVVGSDILSDKSDYTKQVTSFESDAAYIRWHPSNNWIFSITKGNVAATYVGKGEKFGNTVFLTNDNKDRKQLVISHSGEQIAYGIDLFNREEDKKFTQIFVMGVDMKKLIEEL